MGDWSPGEHHQMPTHEPYTNPWEYDPTHEARINVPGGHIDNSTNHSIADNSTTNITINGVKDADKIPHVVGEASDEARRRHANAALTGGR